MREILEGSAARLCARHASDMELQDLTDLVARERELAGDFEGLARHNRGFHEAIHRGAHNRYLEKSLAAVNDSIGVSWERRSCCCRTARRRRRRNMQDW